MTGQVQARIEYVEPGHRDFVAAGPPDRVTAWARAFADRPDAVAAWKPQPDPVRPGWATVRVRLRDSQQPVSRAPVRLTVQSVWPARRPPATPARAWRPVAGEMALYGAGLAVVVGIAWIAVAAFRGAAAWAAGHVVPIVLVVVVVVAVALLWVSNRRGSKPSRRAGGGGHTCPGVPVHCPQCRGA